MACCSSRADKYGYEDSRFDKDVDENLHCSICYNVLKEPRTCRNNDHVFCLSCITEHLSVNRQNCPECNEHLTEDTLRRPRVLNNILSKLKINCDYASRGCPEFTCIEDLGIHVENCGYAPVLCSNENCGMEINKRERVHHEIEVCEYRKVNSHDHSQIQEIIQENIGTLKKNIIELNGNVEATRREVKDNHVEMKKIVGTLEGSLMRINKRINEKVETLNDFQSESEREVKKAVEGVRKEVQDVKGDIFKVRKDVDEVKVMMSQIIGKLNHLEAIKLLSTTDGSSQEQREDILIAGGSGYERHTEIYSWEKNAWFEVSPMNEDHYGASSFIYNGQLFVVAGYQSNTIETIDLNELSLKWMKFPGKLPYMCDDHQTVVCKEHVFHIGGYNLYDRKWSNTICELSLTSTCATAMKELCKMPEPRQCHGAEVFEDKVLILGGEKSFDAGDVLDSVLKFDPLKNECIDMPPLPHPLMRMATVRWKNQVVMLGGFDENRLVVNDVFLYDSKTGKTTVLPSMLEKRYGCCAIITGNTIVIMGGCNEIDKNLKSVECFTMGGSSWEYLPSMHKARCRAVAEALPAINKYV